MGPFADEESPDFRNPSPEVGKGPSRAALPCLPSGALGQCPGYQPWNGSHVLAAFQESQERGGSSWPHPQSTHGRPCTGPQPLAKRPQEEAMTSILWEKLGLYTPEAGLEPHDGKASLLSCRPRHSNMIRPQHCLLGQCSPLVPQLRAGQTQAPLCSSCRARTDLVCAASPPSQWQRRSWYPRPPQTGVTQGCSESLLSRLSPAGLATASRTRQESM